LMNNTILETKLTKRCIVLFTFIAFYYLYLFIMFIFNLFLVIFKYLFKYFKIIIFTSKQIGITISCAIIYKSNIIFFHR
jgi:hypothetical protein